MKIGIIGLGLIGGTIASCLNNRHEITAYDISKETLDYATDTKLINKAYEDLGLFLRENKVIYICLYPTDLIAFFKKHKDKIGKNTLFIEISGIKKSIMSEIDTVKTPDYEIVFTHPVAGSEKIGVKHADKNIFKNTNYIVIPTKENSENNLRLVSSLAVEMGFKNISRLTPEEHDDIIAYTSQLTHIISMSLVSSIDTDLDTRKYIGDSYRDLTRISRINDALWNELFLNNKDFLLKKIKNFQRKLQEFERAITANDSEKLKELMVEARKIKESIDKE